jgi:hypothetical protein
LANFGSEYPPFQHVFGVIFEVMMRNRCELLKIDEKTAKKCARRWNNVVEITHDFTAPT